MPISSSHGQKGKQAKQPWNSTKARRLSSTKQSSNFRTLENNDSSQHLVQNSVGLPLNSRETCEGGRPVESTGRSSLSQPYDNGKRPHTRRLSSRRPLLRRETLPEFYQLAKKSNKVFERCNSDSLIKPCDSSKRKVRRELGSRRIRTFPRRFEGRAVTTQIKTKKWKVDSEAKLFINNKRICFSDFHQTPKEVGQRVICIINKELRTGVTKFIGTTHFSEGIWCGILLDEPCGKNDGSVKGVRYFSCGENYGIFIHVHKVRAVEDNDLGIASQTSTDAMDCKASPDTIPRNARNAQNELKMSNPGTVDFKSQQMNSYHNNECNSKIRSRSFSHDMITGENKSELSENNMLNQSCTEASLLRSNSLPKIFIKKVIRELENKSDLGVEDAGNDSQACKQRGYPDLCNGIDFIIHDKCDPIVCDDLSSKETDPCCEESSRQNFNTKSELQDYSADKSKETKISSHRNVLTNCTDYNKVYTNTISNQVSAMTDKRSYSSDHISVNNNKLTKDSSTPGPHASLEGNETIDAFSQGKYCSCPTLVPSQHLSSALEACIDLGRQELESHSERSTPAEEVKYLDVGQFGDSGSETTLNDDNTECKNSKERLPHHGRSVSLPLVLLPVHHISQTESLFWSLENVSESVVKVERAESWPTLSTSICNLDLRPVVNTDTSVGLSGLESDSKRDSDQEMLAKHCVPKELESNDKKNDVKNITRISAVKQLNNKGNNDCLSQSGSQASMSSVGTSDSQKQTHRKTSASSASSSNSQSRKVKTKSQRKSNSKPIQKSQGKTDLAGNKGIQGRPPMTLKLVKRHTVSGLQKLQPDMAPNTRPSVTRRPTSTLSEPVEDSSPMGSPSYAKSRLPMMKKTPPAGSATKQSASTTSKPQPNVSLTRQAKGAPKDGKKASGSVAEKKKVPGTADKGSSIRKVSTSTPSAQKMGKKVETQVTRRGKITSQSDVAKSGPVDKKSVISAKTTVATSPKPPVKPLRLQATAKGSPTSKTTAGSPTKHYPSRLPRKIISRDTSTDSGHSHEYECDVDTASIGTEGSDFFDGHWLTRGGSFPPDHDQYDADRSDLESSTKSWHYASHAPDILTGTREIHTRAAEVQVQMSEDEASQEIYDKLVHVEELLQLKNTQCQNLEAVISDSNTDILASAMLFIIMCKKLQNNGRLIAQLKNHLHSTESELKQVQERLAEEEENGVKLQEEMMYVRSEHTVAIQNLKADHEDTLEALRYTMKKQLAEEQKKAADAHVAELLELSKVHEEKMAEVKKQNEKAIADVHEKYKDEIVEVESKHSQHIDELLEEHQVEIETIKNDYEEQHGGLESKLFAVTNECTALNMKLQQLQEETEKDIESRIQDAIEKYKSLPAELESIKAVLDMKNEEIKQLRKEQMECKLELDQLRKVAERAKKLEYENESLSFVVENKSKFERQLSVEREQLKNSLDRESKKLKRLSLENEELQWRLYNNSTPPDGGVSPDGAGESPPNSSQRRSFRLSSCSPDVETIDE